LFSKSELLPWLEHELVILRAFKEKCNGGAHSEGANLLAFSENNALFGHLVAVGLISGILELSQ
jgi:hypothetical protein